MIQLTGASGFVGQNLISFLQEKCYKFKSISLRNKNWEEQINPQAEAIIHLAGKAHDTSNTGDPEEYFAVNRDLTIKLFQKFLVSDVRDFFFFSSVKAVADTVNDELIENVKANPLTPYGKSKQEAEEFLLKQVLPLDKRLFIIRPCMIHGPGNKGNLNLLYKIVNKGFPWPLAAYENKRSFLSVENLCFLIYEILLNKSIPSGIYNFADDSSLSTNELIKIIAKASHKKPRYWKLPKSLVKRIAINGDRLNLPLNSER